MPWIKKCHNRKGLSKVIACLCGIALFVIVLTAIMQSSERMSDSVKTALSGIQPTHYSYSYVESKTPPDITNVSPTIDVTNSPRQESYHKQDFRSNQYEYRNEYYGNCPYCKR